MAVWILRFSIAMTSTCYFASKNKLIYTFLKSSPCLSDHLLLKYCANPNPKSTSLPSIICYHLHLCSAPQSNSRLWALYPHTLYLPFCCLIYLLMLIKTLGMLLILLQLFAHFVRVNYQPVYFHHICMYQVSTDCLFILQVVFMFCWLLCYRFSPIET